MCSQLRTNESTPLVGAETILSKLFFQSIKHVIVACDKTEFVSIFLRCGVMNDTHEWSPTNCSNVRLFSLQILSHIKLLVPILEIVLQSVFSGNSTVRSSKMSIDSATSLVKRYLLPNIMLQTRSGESDCRSLPSGHLTKGKKK